jgi:uncharacterized phage-associated protein
MYREDKTTQMAARFLQLEGGKMPYIKLLKLLYIADKQMLVKWGKPITYDRWVAMKYGPVLSNTFDLIKGENPKEAATYWTKFVRTDGYDVVLSDDPGSDDLSRAEDEIIDSVYSECGHRDKWQVVDLTHTFPEWEDPGSTSRPISYQTVLEVEGMPAEAIADILENIEEQDAVAKLCAA